MPKLIKQLGRLITIKGQDEVPAAPGFYSPGPVEKIVTPGYWKGNGGYWATYPAHWEYTTYRTVIDPTWALNHGYYSAAGIDAYDDFSSIYPKYKQVVNDGPDDPKVWVPEERRYYRYPSTWVGEVVSYRQGQSIWHPPVVGVPGIPDVTVRSSVSGWTSWARSINPIAPGAFFNFSVAPGIRGAFCALGIKEYVGRSISDFHHAILVDNSGVHIYEKGTEIKIIKGDCSEVTDMRIIRQSRTSIIYLVVTGGESLIHESTAPAAIVDLYGFGYLYEGGDSLLTSGITDGSIQFGMA